MPRLIGMAFLALPDSNFTFLPFPVPRVNIEHFYINEEKLREIFLVWEL